MKNERIELRATAEDRENLKIASEKLGQKGISKTIRAAVKNFADAEPKEKITYFVKEVYLRGICGVHQLALQYLQKIAADFRTLSIGSITMEDFEQIAARNLKTIKQKFYQTIESDINNIKSEIIRANLLAGVDETFTEFKNNSESNLTAFQSLAFSDGKHYPLSVNHFTVKDGIITFTDDNRELLKNQFCTVYISNPEQERYVSLMEETLKGLSELKKMLISNNVGNLFSISGVEVGVYDEGREDVIIAGGSEFVQYIEK